KTEIILAKNIEEIRDLYNKRVNIGNFIIEYLSKKNQTNDTNSCIQFSTVEILNAYQNNLLRLFEIDIKDIENALLWLHRIQALSLEGGFLVSYHCLEIVRLIKDNKIKYKKDDYKFLDNYYKQKIQQIHIIGELLNILVRNYKKAIEFIKDYFQLDYKEFIEKYFKGRDREIQINMTPGRYKKLFGTLSNKQKEIIEDDKSRFIVVAAGPGSGKTRVLVHKLASLLTLEDIKSEQLLMLTFSRAAAIEFKKRLYSLIGSSAAYVEIKTFHSYCFDILGKPGSLEKSDTIVRDAVNLINNGEVEPSRISKAVLVIDEAQDMSEEDFSLIEALINYNDSMRLIAVGDDDQNIYEFRGSNSKYLKELITKYGAKKYEMINNYRSCNNIVQFANKFSNTIQNRMKDSDCITDKSGGQVKLVKYVTRNIEEPLVKSLIKDKLSGSTCILTKTNDEALRILGILNKKRIPARLIQSLDGFNLSYLQEIRFIMWFLNKNNNPVQITDKLWNDIKFQLQKIFKNSNNLPIILKMLNDFEKTCPTKYYSDLETFFAEAKFEDFYDNEHGVITISTIHKSKGHEFDNVYLLMANNSPSTDENKRKIYVGLTRARNNLLIHYNDDIFEPFKQSDMVISDFDENIYSQPNDIILQLTHKDVVLDYFKYKQKIIPRLRSGNKLIYSEDYLLVNYNEQETKILRFSESCRNKIKNLTDQGYKITDAYIRFIVYWKKQNDEQEKEYAIILPDIKFSKQAT
ncbi:MAG: ATP-dependent helicase, partial [Cyanobacteria bacterium RUI128]|nr:ATP-dependent helicase [Cyanobacteria bacterium RUI128]